MRRRSPGRTPNSANGNRAYADEHAAFHPADHGFSKKVENLAVSVALHYMHYNYARPRKSLGRKMTPAMAAGITDHLWTCEEIAALLD